MADNACFSQDMAVAANGFGGETAVLSVACAQNGGIAQTQVPTCAANEILTGQNGALTCVAASSSNGTGSQIRICTDAETVAAAANSPCGQVREHHRFSQYAIQPPNAQAGDWVVLNCNTREASNGVNRVSGGQITWANNNRWFTYSGGGSYCAGGVVIGQIMGNSQLPIVSVPACASNQTLTSTNGTSLTCVNSSNSSLVENADYFEWNAAGTAAQMMNSFTMTRNGLNAGLWQVSVSGTTFETSGGAAYSVAYDFSSDALTTPKRRGLYIFNHPDGSAPMRLDAIVRVGANGRITVTALGTGTYQGVNILQSNVQSVTAYRIGN